jgi:hypothetical protein
VKRPWPDLAYRARRVGKKEKEKKESEWPGKAQGSARFISAEKEFGDILIALLEKAGISDIETDRGMTEDQYVVHLKDCATCRRNVATFARMGMKIPSRILVAAGVEVLN